MHRLFARRPSPAMVVALLALFISLSGSAFAALNLPRNSVGTRQLKNGAVTTKKIKNGAVTAAKLNLTGVTVPNATHAADATRAITASNATTAASATNAGELGNEPPSSYARSSLFGAPAAFGAGTASSSSYCIVGEIKLFAGLPPAGVALANGQLLPISSNAALFTVLGTTYGGDGKTTFALPDLRGAEPKGQGPHGVSYYICTQGLYP